MAARPKVKMAKWSWREAFVDSRDAHFELRHGTAGDSDWDHWLPVAWVGRPTKRVFAVHFLIDRGQDKLEPVVNDVVRELDFYLVEKGERDLWVYAHYHCGTAANVYSSVHWSFFNGGTT